MKKKLVVVLGIVLTMSLIGCSKKIEEPVEVIEQVIETTEEPTEALEEVTTEPAEELTETTVEVEPETKLTEESVLTGVPTKVTPETTPTKSLEVKTTPSPTTEPETTTVSTPEPEVIVEAAEEEMITGKFNKFNEVKSTYTYTADYIDYDWVFHADNVSTITINKDGLKSAGSYKSYVTNTDWTNNWEYDGTFKYGETKWKYTDSTGDSWEEERVELTKDIAKFGFDFDRFEVKESKTSKDTITITGTYTMSKTANTVYEMLLLEALEDQSVVGDMNKVTADVTITLDLNTKSMKKVVLDCNMNGEVFGTLTDEGELDVFVDSYIHTFEFE